MMADGIERIDGASFADARGVLTYVNALDLAPVRRFYLIRQSETDQVRGWNGHRQERKWFYCIRGAFAIGLVAIDDWRYPSLALSAEVIRVCAEQGQVICVPAGYANAVKALAPESELLVFSDRTLEESKQDSFRWEVSRWVDWETVK